MVTIEGIKECILSAMMRPNEMEKLGQYIDSLPCECADDYIIYNILDTSHGRLSYEGSVTMYDGKSQTPIMSFQLDVMFMGRLELLELMSEAVFSYLNNVFIKTLKDKN